MKKKHHSFYFFHKNLNSSISFFLIILLLLSCGASQHLDRNKVFINGVIDTSMVKQSNIPLNFQDKLINLPQKGLMVTDCLAIHLSKNTIMPQWPVAKKIVENYIRSTNKAPGGHCLTASKSRFLKAYEDVYGHSVYKDLPDRMATKYYSPTEVFDHLYASTSGKHRGWRTLPKKYRGRGSAGAIAQAGMGELIDTKNVWSGKLKPGALIQVWRDKEDYKHVVRGITDPEIDPFGHSFIFLHYTKDSDGKIIGIKIADQGYQSHRTLLPRDYDVWWGANLKI